jgi:hypothetical protein
MAAAVTRPRQVRTSTVKNSKPARTAMCAEMTTGHTIALSVTPEYLVQLGLLDRVPDASSDIGLLLERALENSPAPARWTPPPFRDYFAPHQKRLDEQNRRQPVGW